MSLLIAAHFLKSWNQTGHSQPRFIIEVLRCALLVLLGKGTFQSSFPADSPTIMFTISTAAGRMSSSAIVWGFLHFVILGATLYDASKALLGTDACL
jgi:hypothetical protein